MSSNETELILHFDIGSAGATAGHKYSAKHVSASHDWTLTAERTNATHAFNLTLKCERGASAGCNTADITFYAKTRRDLSDQATFAEHKNISVASGMVVCSKKSFYTGDFVMQVGARITLLESQIPSATFVTNYDFTATSPVCDVKNKVCEETFYANKGVLSVNSPAFCAMFNGEFREKSKDEVVVEDVKPEVFSAFLSAVYPDGEQPTAENFDGLMELADRYDVKSLRNKCENICRRCTGIPLRSPENQLIESMSGAAARQLAAEGSIRVLGLDCMHKPFVKANKCCSDGSA